MLKHDPDLLYAAFDSFNRWMVDEWPFAHEGRLFTLPLISLIDVDRAIVQLEHAIEHGAVAFFLRAGPVPCADGYRSPGDLRFDPFWARVQEAGMAVIVHSSDAGYGDVVARWEAKQDPNGRAGITQSLYSWFTGSEGGRGVSDTVTALIVHGVFGRFPGLRFLSVENGSEWVVPLLQLLKKHSVHYAGRFTGDPVEQFHQNLWVCPFWEEDIESLARHVRIERICAGSDWPHPEGTVQPLDYIDGLKAFSPEEQRRIMRENTLELLGVAGGG
jgi:predicted TIM-barrel fold metal-dependent hydrolase